MKCSPVWLILLILATASTLAAQSPSSTATPKPAKLTAAQIAKNQAAAKKAAKKAEVHLKP
ncbi:MAG TPA: hypothetical protein VGF01_14985 [Terracidiphilus sp.]